MLYSVYVDTEICYAFALRKKSCGAIGLRLPPKHNTYTVRSLPKTSSVYSATTGSNSGIWWNSTSEISRIEAASKPQRWRLGCVDPLHFLLNNCLPTPKHWHRMLQNSHSSILSSSDTVCIFSLLVFLARYINIIYLLDPQLPTFTPIKLDPPISPRKPEPVMFLFHVNGASLA